MSGQRSSADGVRWDLSDLYKGHDDPQIDQDLAKAKEGAQKFEKNFRGRLGQDITPAEMLRAVKIYEEIAKLATKPVWYASLLHAQNTAKPENGALLAKTQEKYTDIRKHLIFVELEWCALSDDKATGLIRSQELRPYKHFLEAERRFKPHKLSEPEEKLLELKNNVGRMAFVRLFDELVGRMTFKVKVGGKTKEISLEETLSMLYEPDRKARQAAAKGLTEGLLAQEKTLAYIFNIMALNHMQDDELRKYPDPMSERNLQNEVDDKVVNALIEAVNAHGDIVARYYRLKCRLMKLDELYDYDRYAPVGLTLPKCTYEEGKKLTLEAFGGFSPKMSEIAQLFFDKGWIDAELKDGKQNGAFASSALPESHPFLLLNYTDTERDAITMAHEMGHGIHQYMARKQGFLQMDTSLAAAETASVFGEMLLFQLLLKRETDPKVRLALLCGKLEDSFATVFRQVMMTRFERRFHEHRRKRGELTPEDFSKLWKEENERMFSGSVEMTDDYAHWWSYVLHFIHYYFYTYAYAFGDLMVLALYDKYKAEGPAFVDKYMQMLETGGALAPKDLVKTVGLDITDPKFWEGGLRQIAEMVDQAEKVAKEAGMV